MEKDGIIEQSIIDAAKVLMQKYGLNKTTMEDIAREAGKGKSTLYHYFKSKEEIFDAVINLEMDELFHSVKKAVKDQKNASDMLKSYIVTKIKVLRSKINLYRFAIETDLQATKINELFSKLRSRYDGEEKNLIAYILDFGVKNNTFKTEIKAEIEVLSELLVTCVRGVELEIVTQGKHKTLESKAELLVHILTQGIGK
ncbi:MAG: TetR/AcrR family transcriptional regulator [Leadbetterella sp.]|nr:TetR/AcrR family transcriptional regulator [Leadbetterella sp.]